jgi:raffinose/stachyose/melibiose transport system permease protein
MPSALLVLMAVLVWVQIGYPVVVFMAALQRVDPELYEAAALDGASWWTRFTRIAVNTIRPEIYVVLVTTTIAALKIFGPVFVLTRGGPGNATLVPSYFAYKNFFEKFNVGYGSAISTVLTVIIVALAVVFLRIQTRSEEDPA